MEYFFCEQFQFLHLAFRSREALFEAANLNRQTHSSEDCLLNSEMESSEIGAPCPAFPGEAGGDARAVFRCHSRKHFYRAEIEAIFGVSMATVLNLASAAEIH